MFMNYVRNYLKKQIEHESRVNMRNIMEALGDSGLPGNVRLKPLGYLAKLMLMAKARKILTDSGVFRRRGTCWGTFAIG